MKIRSVHFFRVPALIFCLLASSCGKDTEEDFPLTNVAVQESSLSLEEGKTGTLNFQVTDPGYPISTDVNSPDCEVSIITADNHSPRHFSLAGISKLSGEGQYTATLLDNASGEQYQEEIHLRIRRKDGSYVLSGRITVKSKEIIPVVTPDTGLPIIYIETENRQAITSKEDYLNATFRINGRGVAEGLDEVTCQIRGRGNTTWGWPKKPYLVKFDSKQSLFGFPKHKRWVLLANFMDRTMMRNLVAMKVSSMTGLDWTPRCQSVELVLNGKHVGNYLLIEQVRVDKNRVPVTEMSPEDTEGDALTGGYMLELDFHFDNKFQWLSEFGHSNEWIRGRNDVVPFGIKYPDEDDINNTQINYIKKYINDTATALYGDDFTDQEKGYAAWIDVDSFIDYWIVFEVMGNHELGNPGSVYMHKDRGGKLIAGPCWDFDWGVLSYKTSPQAKNGLLNRNAIWYARLFDDPAFKAKVKARFGELLPKLETVPDYIDQMQKTLEKSAALNFAMWNPAEDGMINGDESMTFDAAVSRLKENFSERLEVIQRNL
ncbi:MAG: CotH kinase family protein [Bacteroidales bacterium]|nr:CotH kinase family protein [Bacteroidales bacterium]